jgi:glycosyltransferase involved in cell wall biosynthesis
MFRKILFVGQKVKGRYKGGIMNIFQILESQDQQKLSDFLKVKLEFFNSHAFPNSPNTEGKFKFQNIIQFLYLIIRLINKINSFNPRIVHFNTSAKYPFLKDLIAISIVTRFFNNVEFILHIHMCGFEEVFVKNKKIRDLQIKLLKMHHVIVLSKHFKQELTTRGFHENKVFYLPNFHNYSLSSNSFKPPKGVLKIIFIGSITQRKGFKDLLSCLSYLDFKYELSVLGNFDNIEFENYCYDFIKKYNLNVSFLGYLNGDDKVSILKNSHVLVLPSYSEGFPMVIPEGFAFGLCIISSNIYTISEIIRHKENGLIVPVGDVLGLAKIIKLIFNDTPLMLKMSSNSFESSKTFTLGAHLMELGNIYGKILREYE